MPFLLLRLKIFFYMLFQHHSIVMFIRAGGGTWTPDLLITNQLLYQLSYASKINLCF